MGKGVHRWGVALALAGAMLALPSGASADVSCTFDAGTKTVTVTISEANDVAYVIRSPSSVNSGNNINFGEFIVNAFPGSQCGTATVNNTDTIQVNDTSGAGTEFLIDMTNGQFAPGPTDESDTSEEIEFRVDLATGGASDEVAVTGTAGADNVRSGPLGINLNFAPANVDTDADVTNPAATAMPTGLDAVVLDGRDGADQLRADGDPSDISGTGGVATIPHRLVDDLATAFSDDLRGGLSGDTLLPVRGDDIALGGGGSDTVDYNAAGAGVTVNLALAGPQNTGGAGTDTIEAEQAIGSPFNDVLTGGSGPNNLFGAQGMDILTGAGGTDSLFGAADPDQIFARDGASDTVNCGDPNPPDVGADAVETDAAGVDTIANCETVQFPPPPVLSQPATTGSVDPICVELTAKLKRLNRKIKRADDPDEKAKLKDKRRKVRRQLAALACP